MTSVLELSLLRQDLIDLLSNMTSLITLEYWIVVMRPSQDWIQDHVFENWNGVCVSVSVRLFWEGTLLLMTKESSYSPPTN